MPSRTYLKVANERLFLCQEAIDKEFDLLSERTVEAINGYIEIEITAELHAGLLNHYTVLGRRPKAPSQPKRAGSIEGFERCWDAYPRRDAKAAARKAWIAQGCDRHADAVFGAIVRMAASDAWQSENGRYVPYLSTFLNQRRWEDDAADQPQQLEDWL